MLTLWTKGKKYGRSRIINKSLLRGESLRGNHCRIRVAAMLLQASLNA
jgi:hypothetical protein